MRMTMKWIAILLISQLFATGLATAQESPGDQPAPSDLRSGDNLALIEEDIDSLSGQEKLSRAQQKVQTMRGMLQETVNLLESARATEKDILKINCINEKLAAIKGFVKVSEQSYANLQNAVSTGDKGAAKHHYTLVSVAHQKVLNLSEEAKLCTGEEQRYTGSMELTVEVDPDIGPELEVPVDDDDYILERLPDVTPYD